jgi:hypothetical protein
VTIHLKRLGAIIVIGLTLGAVARAQEKPGPPTQKSPAIVPLKVQVIISRYQGEKKVSSLPYTLSVNANDRGSSSLRMGAQVPIATAMMPLVDSVGKSSVPQSFQYKDVGTNIDCSASSTDDGRYRLAITIEDSSIITDEKAQPGQVKGNPSFRSFRSTETLLLRDGQTLQFTSATDKISGDVVKVDVTLTVIR